MGSFSLDVIFKFLATESTFQIEADRMSSGGFALSSEQDFGSHTPCMQNTDIFIKKIQTLLKYHKQEKEKNNFKGSQIEFM